MVQVEAFQGQKSALSSAHTMITFIQLIQRLLCNIVFAYTHLRTH